MREEEYQAAAAQTAQLAAQLPRIGVATRPVPGPSMPQRMINRFRNQEAVLGMLHLVTLAMHTCHVHLHICTSSIRT